MNRTRALTRFLLLLRVVMLVVVSSLFVAVPKSAAQQDIVDDEWIDVTDIYCDPENGDDCTVESVSAILATSTTTEIDTYNATYVTFDLLMYDYSAYVEGYLYADDALYGDGYAFDDGSGAAELDGFTGIDLSGGSVAFALISDSYLYDDINDVYDYILSTEADATLGAPEITSVSPSYAFVGRTGTLTITGQALINPFGGGTTTVNAVPATPGATGLTITGNGFSDTSGTASYSATLAATPGPWDIGLSTSFGDTLYAIVAHGLFTVGDPTPVVTSVSPGAWAAGASTSFTISGTGFGTAPTVTISGAGIVSYTTTPVSDTSITGTVIVSSTAPGGPVVIQVQSNGYYGSGFVPAYPGQSSTGSGAATIIPFVPPTPAIVFGTNSSQCSGSNLVGTVQNKIVGQQIALVGCVTLPGGLYQTSQSWTVQGSVVGGYSASAASGTGFTVPNYTSTAILFYWYYATAGTQNTVQYSYCMNNGLCSSAALANVTFSLAGPTNLKVVVCPSSTAASCPMNNMQVVLDPNVAKLEAGNFSTPAYSIQVVEYPPLTPPAGAGTGAQVQWTQLISNDSLQFLTSNQQYCQGGPICDAVPNGWTGAPVLDNYYPYPVIPSTPWGVNDTPSYQVGAIGEYEAQRSFHATMYLLWDPALPTGCSPATTVKQNGQYVSTPSQCTQSIPIPLGTVAWNVSGCAVNTLSTNSGDNGTAWHLACGIPSQNAPENPAFTASTGSLSSYPTWSLASHNGNMCVAWTCTKQ